ncbi:hypothetical protein BB559_003385 [Furculomyces boomerangus]|uniref:Serine/threonine-protein phosphatase 2A activator n=2 Tax=Harpellales TaxID=61421 RepID=A0A2T9YLQ4_9FUNG|nr:hypothetical protein BB559_003385 [Furculomyces boomerangus]PWA02211.1 hypothetical protein BB558_001655 [Smittium angustum]
MYSLPTRQITKIEDINLWNRSRGKNELVGFITQLSTSVKGKRISEENTESKEAKELILPLLDGFDTEYIVEIVPYFVNSFGNKTRIDYGSGHEMMFLILILCLSKIGVYEPKDSPGLVLIVFQRYLELVRKVQTLYKLEPAGSHGVWGLDDYQFLVYYFGSSQFIGTNTKPIISINTNYISENKSEYLYLQAIDFINKTKSGPFFEHSPQLNEISGVPTWEKVNSGLMKMYLAEVLRKFPVVQHLIFGTLFSFEPEDIQTA